MQNQPMKADALLRVGSDPACILLYAALRAKGQQCGNCNLNISKLIRDLCPMRGTSYGAPSVSRCLMRHLMSDNKCLISNAGRVESEGRRRAGPAIFRSTSRNWCAPNISRTENGKLHRNLHRNGEVERKTASPPLCITFNFPRSVHETDGLHESGEVERLSARRRRTPL